MKKNLIVIATNPFDLTSDRIIMCLRESGEDPIRLHGESLPNESTVSIRLDGDHFSSTIDFAGRKCNLADARSVLWRKPEKSKIPQGLDEDQAQFAKEESHRIMMGMWSTLDTYWMSKPRLIHIAQDKPEQLRRALLMGFDIPKTLLTNSVEDLILFKEACNERIIFKAIGKPHHHFQGEYVQVDGNTLLSKHSFTTNVTDEEIENFGEQIKHLPCLFQERIEKLVELRVIVIGKRVFVGEIDSQAQAETVLDWRHYEVPMIIREGRLPTEVSDRCLAYVESYGLTFGALDLILTPGGKYVFLENNPAGEWAFLDSRIPNMNNKLTKHMCRCLIAGESV